MGVAQPPAPIIEAKAIDSVVIDEEGVDEKVCLLCGGTPCFWTQHGTSVHKAVQNLVVVPGNDEGKAVQDLVAVGKD